ncbi:HNH endonuclease signature motif containing protein [Psychrobacillus sp. FSL W7-1457]|uniref:HNH endonuclease n=1 Tax=Psychrobacillus sp. FSL W7-1457 TaxID=2954547 RepID=UPI00315A66EE
MLAEFLLQQKLGALKKELIANLTAEQWFETFQYFKGRCAYCEIEGYLTQDHFIPLSNMGIYSKSNIIPACEPCNYKKSTKDFDIWYKAYDHYSEDREKKILEFLKGVLEEKV